MAASTSQTTSASEWDGIEDALRQPDGRAGGAERVGEVVDDLVTGLESASYLDVVNRLLGPVAGRLDRGRLGSVLSGEWLGHALHPMLTDLPIGFWTSSWVLDVVGGKSSRTASRRLIGLGVAAALPTAASGAVEWNRIPTAGTGRVGVAHAIANTTALALYFASWRARHRGRHVRGVALAQFGALAATAGGHLGGHLAFALGVGHGHRRQERATI
jgi:uncharacterized membrane protein